jgi:hypothetical protein
MKRRRAGDHTLYRPICFESNANSTTLNERLEAADPMGVVTMSKRELNRIDVLARLDGRRLTTLSAADLMRVARR